MVVADGVVVPVLAGAVLGGTVPDADGLGRPDRGDPADPSPADPTPADPTAAPAVRPAPCAAADAAASTSTAGRPVSAATRATSSNSGVARTTRPRSWLTLMPTRWPSTATSTQVRGSACFSTVVWRSPIVEVCACTTERSRGADSGVPSTVRTCAGRPFFMAIGASQASCAPAPRSAVRTPGHNRGSRSSTFASSTTPVWPLPGTGTPVRSPTRTRVRFGRPAVSRVPAPLPEVSRVRAGRSSQAWASVVTRAMPVGVVSSPGPSPRTRQPRDSSTTAGPGTAMRPWAIRTVPEPRATSPALRVSTPRSASAAHTPTTSAIESSAPTSWKCTSAAGIPCACASASASRPNTASASRRTRSSRDASASITWIVRQSRCGGSSTSIRTSALVARMPARVTVRTSMPTAPATTASTAA